MLRTVWFLVVVSCAFIVQGCSVWMAARCPTERDYRLAEGTPRAVVVNLFGAPVDKGSDGTGRQLETYKFTDGLPLWSNILRGVGYGAGDLFTLCISEAVFTPLEYGLQEGLAEPMVAEVRYDAGGRVAHMQVVDSGGEKVYETSALALATPKAASSAR